MSNENHTLTLNNGQPQPESTASQIDETIPVQPVAVEGAVDPTKGKKTPKIRGIHVVSANEKWHVKESGRDHVLFEHAIKKEAIKFATTQAKSLKTELLIHGQDGKIQTRNSYGPDPKGGG